MTINIGKIKKDIENEIKKCDAYLEMTTDPFAEERVSELDKNPCNSDGIYYLNAIYKDNHIENLPLNISNIETVDYNSELIDGYIVRDNGLFMKDKLEVKASVTAPELDSYISNDTTVYIDYSMMIDKISLQAAEDASVEHSASAPDCSFFVSFSGLGDVFSNCIVTTQSVLNDISSPNELEINGQPKVKTLFNWTNWSKYIKKQKETYANVGITEGVEHLTRLDNTIYINM